MNRPLIILLLLKISITSSCSSQGAKAITPSLEIQFQLGDKNFFEIDVKYMKGVLDNEMYKVNNYSFLPNLIYSNSDLVIFFDKFSGNFFAYNIRSKKIVLKSGISNVIKQQQKANRFNVDIVDIDNNKTLFYDNLKKEILIFNFDTEALECRLQISNPIAMNSNNNAIHMYGYITNNILRNCTSILKTNNERIVINKAGAFVKSNDYLYYQHIEGAILRTLKTDSILIKESVIIKGDVRSFSNYNLVHVNHRYYVLAASVEKGLGEFLFINKTDAQIEKEIKIDVEVLNNGQVDFYDAISDAPSPDVDDTNTYIRMTSISDKYFIFFQSKGTLYLYSFDL